MTNPITLAALPAEVFLPALFMLILATIALVAMGSFHNRKMAEINARPKGGDEEQNKDMEELKAAIHELRSQLHAQMIQIDTLVQRQGQMLEGPAPSPGIAERLHAGTASVEGRKD